MTTGINLRPENESDAISIERITRDAFAGVQYSDQREHKIIAALRDAHALTVSWIAEDQNQLLGHVAISPVTISDRRTDWYGLGPVSVHPVHQKLGIGTKLVQKALSELQKFGAEGCVVLGDPAFYQRFGFRHEPKLILPGLPNDYFMALAWTSQIPQGTVSYHPAFDA